MIIDATKKISKGYYTGSYNGINFTVSKVDGIDANTKNKWHWTLTESGECGQDWYSMKRGAILAVIERISNIYSI